MTRWATFTFKLSNKTGKPLTNMNKRRYQVSDVNAFDVVSFAFDGAVERDLAPVAGGVDVGTSTNQPSTKLKKKIKFI
jgi:hypothetical protein